MSEVKDWGEPWVVVSGTQSNATMGDSYEWAALNACDGRASFAHADIENIDRLERIRDCVNAFAGLDPAKSVVVSIEDARSLLLGDMENDKNLCPAIDRLCEAIAKKEGV